MKDQPEEFEGGGAWAVVFGLVIVVWILRALMGQADRSKD